MLIAAWRHCIAYACIVCRIWEQNAHARAGVGHGGLRLQQHAVAVNKLDALLADVCQPQVGEGIGLVVDFHAEILADLTLKSHAGASG